MCAQLTRDLFAIAKFLFLQKRVGVSIMIQLEYSIQRALNVKQMMNIERLKAAAAAAAVATVTTSRHVR